MPKRFLFSFFRLRSLLLVGQMFLPFKEEICNAQSKRKFFNCKVAKLVRSGKEIEVRCRLTEKSLKVRLFGNEKAFLGFMAR